MPAKHQGFALPPLMPAILCFALCVPLWLALPSHNAHAQQGSIRLFTTQTTYEPGRQLTAYVYFFRVRQGFAFFNTLARHIGHSADFQLKARRRLFSYQEQMRDNSGFPVAELTHALYRIRLMPKNNGGTLRYGPVKFRGLSSNTLTFNKRAASLPSRIQVKTHVPQKNLKEGQSFQLQLSIRCPQTLCDYTQIQTHDLLRHLQRKTLVSTAKGLLNTRKQVRPQIIQHNSASPPAVEIRFNYTLHPLQGGTLKTPQVTVSLPVLEVIDQSLVQRDIRQWLIKKHRFSTYNAARYINLRPQKISFVSFRQIQAPTLPLQITPSKGSSGDWKLQSRLISSPATNKPLWHISLTGQGFLLRADNALRKMLRKTFETHKLDEELRLAHYRWLLPSQSLSQNVSIHMYFAFKHKRIALPALQMLFTHPKGHSYQQKTAAIGTDARLSPSQTSFQMQKNDRRVYIYHDNPLNKKQFQEVDVWAYNTPGGFPLFHALSRGWEMQGNLSLKHERKTKNIVHRSSRRSGFGAFFQMSTRRLPIDVSTARLQAKEKAGPLAKIPTVQWGGQWLGLQFETGRGLSLQAKTSRTRYFVGESIEYRLTLKCPTADCPAKTAGFYSQIFQANLKLPNFDRFSGWRRLDRFTRKDHNGWTTFLYRVRFKAPQTKTLNLKSATLRLPARLLQRLHQKNQICFFRSERSEGLLLSSIVRDHYNQSSQEDCSLETQELSSPALAIPIDPLPQNAQGIKLIGSFRIKARLQQLTYPNKQATVVDKPFYLVVDIAGSGDLQTARDLLRDQLSQLARDLRKKNVTADIETPNDKDLAERGILRIQLQLIAEQEGNLKFPSLRLKHYLRDEGVLTAQTLPLSLRIEPRTGPRATVIARTAQPTPSTTKNRQLLQETDLRPNQPLGARLLVNQRFSLLAWQNLLTLLCSPLLFLLFLGWHQLDKRRLADPKKVLQQRSLKQCKQALKELQQTPDDWERKALNALQQYFIARLSLSQKQLTAAEAKDLLRERLDASLPPAAESLLKQMQTLEASLYGGDAISTKRTFLQELEQHVSTLHPLLPQTKQS